MNGFEINLIPNLTVSTSIVLLGDLMVLGETDAR